MKNLTFNQLVVILIIVIAACFALSGIDSETFFQEVQKFVSGEVVVPSVQ